MLALVTTPGQAGSTEVADVPAPSLALARDDGRVLVRTLEIGVCGTDREISEGRFGVAPDGERRLVLGHEFLGVVERDGHGFTAGDLVSATVRRSCGHCRACEEQAPDSCFTGDYAERGIIGLDGYAAELVAEAPEHLVPVPAALGRLGVLAEPASVCARGIRHARMIAERQPWQPRRALVLGAGAIGMLSAVILRLDGYEVWATSLSPRSSPTAALAEACGVVYASTADTPPTALAEEAGGFDLVVEATGDSQVMLDTLGLLARNGVACLLGIDGRPRELTLDGRTLGVDAISGNRTMFGSMNANRIDWLSAVDQLARACARWPDALDAFVGLRVGVDRFEEAFAFDGVKASLALR